MREQPVATAEQAAEHDISLANIMAAVAELAEAIGEEWVSDDPVILTTYSRDMTPQHGRWPNIVVLPGSTADVQEVVRVARARAIPVVIMTTGFNIGGMCLPRRGGILVDLKRMNELCEIDEESMTLTMSPYVLNAPAYEECSKRFAAEGVRLRPANPITMGSVSLFSNYISGGASHIAYKTGNHHENIVSMTWVLPDGEILQTGSSAYPVLGRVPQLGPGPDMGGAFLASCGNFGICTEITIRLFPELPYEKTLLIALEEDKSYDLDVLADFYYRLGRENIAQAFYKSGNRHMAMLTIGKVEDIVGTLAVHILIVDIVGISEEELRLKEERVHQIVEEVGDLYVIPDFVKEQLFSAQDLTEAEALRVMTKRMWRGGRAMRWRGSFQWMAFPVKFEHIPDLERRFRRIVDRLWVPTDPKQDYNEVPFAVSLQGPFQLARFVAFEFDFFVDHGNPDEMKRFTRLFIACLRMMINAGAMVGRNVAFSHELQMPRLGTYAELVKSLKQTLDPGNLMSPDVMPLTEDFLS